MGTKNEVLTPQLKAIKTTDLSPFIRMGGLIAPRLIENFLPKLNEKQRKAFDKIMPPHGGMKFYIYLMGTPTPPIVIEMSQPLKMSVESEEFIKNQQLKGLRLTIENIQAGTERKFGKLIWQLKGQTGTLLSLSGLAAPLIQLGSKEIKDLKEKALIHFKPLIEMMPK